MNYFLTITPETPLYASLFRGSRIHTLYQMPLAFCGMPTGRRRSTRQLIGNDGMLTSFVRLLRHSVSILSQRRRTNLARGESARDWGPFPLRPHAHPTIMVMLLRWKLAYPGSKLPYTSQPRPTPWFLRLIPFRRQSWNSWVT